MRLREDINQQGSSIFPKLRLISTVIAGVFLLSGCLHRGDNPVDPYEQFNRKVHRFNMALDSALLKPVANYYKGAVPGFIRKGVNNAYNNLDLIPTVANDILQREKTWAIKDTWRFIINSTLELVAYLMSLALRIIMI